MRIRQSICLKNFEANFRKKYGLISYSKFDEPLIIFGLFHQPLINHIAKRKAMTIIVWIGSDAMYMRQGKLLNYTSILRLPNIKHIAISKWIVEDLSAKGVPHIFIPITHVPENNFQPTPLGNKVYFYGNSKRPTLYGQDILEEVKKKLPDYKFIETTDYYDRPYSEMEKIYNDCFIGLRPTRHDGQPTTVIELGYMGRRCIHNGNAPNAIHWENVDDIVESIKKETVKIGTIDYKLAEQVRKYTSIGDNWLNTEFYK